MLIPCHLLSLSLANLQDAFISFNDKSSRGDIWIADLTDRSFIPASALIREEPLSRVANALLTLASEGGLPVRIPRPLLLQVFIVINVN